MSRTHFTQALVANLILGVATAVVVFGEQLLPALFGGVCAASSFYIWFRLRARRTDNVSERK